MTSSPPAFVRFIDRHQDVEVSEYMDNKRLVPGKGRTQVSYLSCNCTGYTRYHGCCKHVWEAIMKRLDGQDDEGDVYLMSTNIAHLVPVFHGKDEGTYLHPFFKIDAPAGEINFREVWVYTSSEGPVSIGHLHLTATRADVRELFVEWLTGDYLQRFADLGHCDSPGHVPGSAPHEDPCDTPIPDKEHLIDWWSLITDSVCIACAGDVVDPF